MGSSAVDIEAELQATLNRLAAAGGPLLAKYQAVEELAHALTDLMTIDRIVSDLVDSALEAYRRVLTDGITNANVLDLARDALRSGGTPNELPEAMRQIERKANEIAPLVSSVAEIFDSEWKMKLGHAVVEYSAAARALGNAAVEGTLDTLSSELRRSNAAGAQIVRAMAELATYARTLLDTVRDSTAQTESNGPEPPNLFRWYGKAVELPAMQWRLLEFLWGCDGRKAQVDDAITQVWSDSDPKQTTVKGTVSKLSTALSEAGMPVSTGIKNGYIVLSIFNE